MSTQFIIERPNEENFSISLGDKYLGSYNHDDDGWAGMASVEKIVYAIAKELNIEVVEKYPEEDSEE